MAGTIGFFLGSFMGSLFLAAIWLIIAKLSLRPPTRRNIAISYGIAMALAFVPQLLLFRIGGVTFVGILASFVCIALLFWQYKRELIKLAGPSGELIKKHAQS